MSALLYWPCRYSGQHIATSLTLSSTERPGCMLLNKVLSYMRPKMHALLLDSTINSPLTIRLNIYQVLLTTADCQQQSMRTTSCHTSCMRCMVME